MTLKTFNLDVLAELGITENDIPCFLSCGTTGENLETIYIHTRTGGGNRDYWESEESRKTHSPESDLEGPYNDDLRKLPGYLRDEDSEYDNTYAVFYFDRAKAKEEMERKKAAEAPAEAQTGALIKVLPTHLHFKGGSYRYVARGLHSENHQKLVAYVDLSTGAWWFGPLEMFLEKTRYTPIEANKEPTHIIGEKRLKTLLEAEKKLQALESHGVDNWEWYGDAMQDVYGNEDDEGDDD